MEKTTFLLMGFALIISWGIVMMIFPRYWMQGQKMKYVLKENEFLKRASRRYELVKECNKTDKFFNLLRKCSYEDIDEFILAKIKNHFRVALDVSDGTNGFLVIYLFIGTLEGEIKDLLQKTFLEVFRGKGTVGRGILLFDSVIEKGQPAKAAIEKTIVDIGDSDFSRKCYFHAAEHLKNYITIQLGDIVESDFKTELKKELSRLKSLSV